MRIKLWSTETSEGDERSELQFLSPGVRTFITSYFDFALHGISVISLNQSQLQLDPSHLLFFFSSSGNKAAPKTSQRDTQTPACHPAEAYIGQQACSTVCNEAFETSSL